MPASGRRVAAMATAIDFLYNTSHNTSRWKKMMLCPVLRLFPLFFLSRSTAARMLLTCCISITKRTKTETIHWHFLLLVMGIEEGCWLANLHPRTPMLVVGTV